MEKMCRNLWCKWQNYFCPLETVNTSDLIKESKSKSN